MIRDRNMQDVSVETNLWDCQLKDVNKIVVKDSIPKDLKNQFYKTGMDIIARGKGTLIVEN